MQRLQFLSTVTLTGSGQTPAFSLSEVKQGAITLSISAASGTTPKLTVYLQESDDGGTTWYDVVADVIQKTVTTAAEDAAAANKRNICTEVDAAGTYRGHYSNLASDYYRIKYVLSGTSPQYTVSIALNAK